MTLARAVFGHMRGGIRGWGADLRGGGQREEDREERGQELLVDQMEGQGALGVSCLDPWPLCPPRTQLSSPLSLGAPTEGAPPRVMPPILSWVWSWCSCGYHPPGLQWLSIAAKLFTV